LGGNDHQGLNDRPASPKAGGPSRPKENHISIGFEVQDIKKTSKELEAKGIEFHYQENEINYLAFFKDPDGTHLYLTQVH
jgi:predicted enzyme related to lactoylglutathione lyase